MSDEEHELLSNKKATKKILKIAGKYAVARLTVSAIIIGNGVVFARLGSTANKAGPLVTTLIYSVMGSTRGVMLSTGILAGNSYGRSEYAEIGNIVKKSWILGGILTIPVTGILLSSQFILEGVGINPEVAEEVEKYFIATAFGIPAVFWLASDQQATIAVKKVNSIFLSSVGYALLTMGVGYPLALNKLGIAGLGYGVGIAAWASLILLRLYFKWKSSYFKQFDLFNVHCRPLRCDAFSNLFRYGLAMGFQSFSEWGNLFFMSMIIGHLDKPNAPSYLEAFQVSLQPISAFNMMLLGYAQGLSVLIAEYRGIAHRSGLANENTKVLIAKKNAKKIGIIGIIISFIAGTMACCTFILLSEQLLAQFSSNMHQISSGSDHAKRFLLINSLGLITDSMRNTIGSIVTGNGFPWFSSLVSFIVMTVLCGSIGGMLLLALDEPADWLFITRDIGISLSALILAHHWYKTNKIPISEQQPLLSHNHQSTINEADNTNFSELNGTYSCCSFLYNLFKRSQSNEPEINSSNDEGVTEQATFR